METRGLAWGEANGWSPDRATDAEARLNLYFSTGEFLAHRPRYRNLQRSVPSTQVLGCRKRGHIAKSGVSDDVADEARVNG